MTTDTDRPADPQTSTYAAVAGWDDWMRLAEVSYRRLAEAFAALDADAWSRPTPCEGWTVRDLAGHLVGAMRSAASLRESGSQQLTAMRRAKRDGVDVDVALTALQLERTADRSPEQLVAEMTELVTPAVRGRGKLPAPLRRVASVRVVMGDIDERWTMDYFLGCILTRDAWLHRIDLADALGVDPALEAVDREVVGDVAVEWARRHGRPVALHLTGEAGGTLLAGDDGDRLELDAVEFCRVLSGRSHHDHPLLATSVPF